MANKTFEFAGLQTPNKSPISKSHINVSSCDFMQFRVPYWEEILPGDDISVKLTDYMRTSPLASLIYGNYRVKTAAFFVPSRLVMENFHEFITGGATGSQTYQPPMAPFGCFVNEYIRQAVSDTPSIAPVSASIKARGRNYYDLLVDMGLPLNNFHITYDAESKPVIPQNVFTGGEYEKMVNVLPFRALSKVWFDWFRDSNLIRDDAEKQYVDKGQSPLTTESTSFVAFSGYSGLFATGVSRTSNALVNKIIPWEKDYFTTAFTDPQRGAKSVVGVEIAQKDLNPALQATSSANAYLRASAPNETPSSLNKVFLSSAGSDQSQATSILGQFDVIALRAAQALQKFLEKSNIAGASKLTQLLAHFGTAPSPKVLGISEYLGSNEYSMNIDEVVSTAETDEMALGDMTTKINGGGTFECNYSANEHGYFFVVQFIRPERIYMPAFDRRLFNRETMEDYFTPEYEHIAYQPIYYRELMRPSQMGIPWQSVFGYAPRYAEYKFAQSRYTGQVAAGLYPIVSDPSYDANLTTGFTMCHPSEGSRLDNVFKLITPEYDHITCRWTLDVGMKRIMSPYGQNTISDITGHDITLPYAGIRL